MCSSGSLHKKSKSFKSKIEKGKEDNVRREEYLLAHVVPSHARLRLGIPSPPKFYMRLGLRIPSPPKFYTWFRATPVQLLTETWNALGLGGKYKVKTQTKKRKS